MSNSLNPDQAQHFVGPDLVLSCLQGYQQKAYLIQVQCTLIPVISLCAFYGTSTSGAIPKQSAVFVNCPKNKVMHKIIFFLKSHFKKEDNCSFVKDEKRITVPFSQLDS